MSESEAREQDTALHHGADIVDPDRFKVPYSIAPDGLSVFHVKDGRPQDDSIVCPLCKGRVSFIRETDRAAAHFRHHTASSCDALAAHHRETLHDHVRDAAHSLLRSGVHASRIVSDARGLAMPKGRAVVEEAHTAGGTLYRPDITVHPIDGEAAPTLELEVIYSHEPTVGRLRAAAEDGRIVGVLNISSIERDYYKKLWWNEAWDIPDAAREFVLRARFRILGQREIRERVQGIVWRIYKQATVRQEHRAIPPTPAAPISLHRPPKPRFAFDTGGPVKPLTSEIMPWGEDWEAPVCAHCGHRGWAVGPGSEGGPLMHFDCWMGSQKEQHHA